MINPDALRLTLAILIPLVAEVKYLVGPGQAEVAHDQIVSELLVKLWGPVKDQAYGGRQGFSDLDVAMIGLAEAERLRVLERRKAWRKLRS